MKSGIKTSYAVTAGLPSLLGYFLASSPHSVIQNGLSRHTPGELFVVLCLLDTYSLISGIQDSLHE